MIRSAIHERTNSRILRSRDLAISRPPGPDSRVEAWASRHRAVFLVRGKQGDLRSRAMRRFVGDHSEGLLYLAAGLTYIVFGIWQKWALNWLIGPLWLLVWVWLIPAAWRRLRGEPPFERAEDLGRGEAP